MRNYLSVIFFSLIFLSVSYANSIIEDISIEDLQNIVFTQKSMNEVLIAMGNPYHVGLSSEDAEGTKPQVSDSIIFYYERDIRLSQISKIHKCIIMIYYDKCRVKSINLNFFRMGQQIVDPEEITAKYGNNRRIIYRRFNGEGPESDLADSDKPSADVEIWIYGKHGLKVSIFKKYFNQVGSIDISYDLLHTPRN